MATTTLKGQPFDRPTLDSMLRRRMFYTPSFEIYGGTAGLYDYGPVSSIENHSILIASQVKRQYTAPHIFQRKGCRTCAGAA